MAIKSQTPNKNKRQPASRRRPLSNAKKTSNERKLLSLPIAPRTRLFITFERLGKPDKKKSKASLKSKQKRASKRPSLASRAWRNASPVIIVLILGGLTGLLYFGVQTVHPTKPAALYSPPVPKTILSSKAKDTYKALPKSEPTQLRAPSVGIDTPLMSIGRNSDGTMEVPPLGVHIAGWYREAPTPGEVGPAVITGHVDTYKGPSVFYRLRQLKSGEIIEVTRKDGKTAKFKIDTVKDFPRDKFPTQEVYGQISYSGLRLITCGGSFNRATQQYDHNTVVFATLIT